MNRAVDALIACGIEDHPEAHPAGQPGRPKRVEHPLSRCIRDHAFCSAAAALAHSSQNGVPALLAFLSTSAIAARLASGGKTPSSGGGAEDTLGDVRSALGKCAGFSLSPSPW